MHLTAPELAELLHCHLGHGVGGCADGKGDEGLIGVQSGVAVAQMIHLQVLDGIKNHGRDQVQLIGHTCQPLQSVEQQCRGGTQQVGGAAGDDGSVRQLHSGSGIAGLFRPGQRRSHHLPLPFRHPGLLHQKLQLAHRSFAALALLQIAHGHIIAADDLLPGGFPGGLIVNDAESDHVDTHIRGGLIGAVAQNLFKNGHQNRVGLHIPVVIDGRLPIGFQMEGVDHIHVVQVSRCRLVGQIHRMVQGQIPDGEGLKLGVSGGIALLMLVVQLAQAHRQLAAAGAGGSHHHQRAGGFNVIIFSEALGADNVGGIVGVAVNIIVVVHPDAHALQPGLECLGHGLLPEPGQHHAGYIQAKIPEYIDQPDHIPVIGNAQVPPDLVLFNVVGIDDNDHLHLFLQLQKHPQLAVRLEARQNTGSMVVIIELTAEFQIQLAAEFGDPLPDVGRLGLQVFFIIECDCRHGYRLFQNQTTS